MAGRGRRQAWGGGVLDVVGLAERRDLDHQKRPRKTVGPGERVEEGSQGGGTGRGSRQPGLRASGPRKTAGPAGDGDRNKRSAVNGMSVSTWATGRECERAGAGVVLERGGGEGIHGRAGEGARRGKEQNVCAYLS